MEYLVGKSVKLVKFTERYKTPKYIEWLNDHSINRYLYVGRIPISAEEIPISHNDKGLFFAIMSNIGVDSGDNLWKDDNFNHYVGTISFSSIDWICRKAEVGYLIGEKTHWGCGVATEAVKLMSDYGFNRLGFHKIEAGVVEGNTGSMKLLEKNGFKEYCVIPDDYYLEGKFLNTHRFYKLEGW